MNLVVKMFDLWRTGTKVFKSLKMKTQSEIWMWTFIVEVRSGAVTRWLLIKDLDIFTVGLGRDEFVPELAPPENQTQL